MGAFSSIKAKVAGISAAAASIYGIYRVIENLPERMEAFKEGNYVEAFLGEKWAKVLNPDAYADEDTKQAEASSNENTKTEESSQEEQASSEESKTEQARDPDLAAETDAILASVDGGSAITESYEMG